VVGFFCFCNYGHLKRLVHTFYRNGLLIVNVRACTCLCLSCCPESKHIVNRNAISLTSNSHNSNNLCKISNGNWSATFNALNITTRYEDTHKIMYRTQTLTLTTPPRHPHATEPTTGVPHTHPPRQQTLQRNPHRTR
jgi:hypothetical protein